MMCILVVEDEEFFSDLLFYLLCCEGYEVVIVVDGCEVYDVLGY